MAQIDPPVIKHAPRLVLKLPTWEDYVSVALDEIISIGSGSIQVGRRVRRLLEELLALAPSQHRQSVESRLEAVSAALQNRRGGPCVSGPVGSPA